MILEKIVERKKERLAREKRKLSFNEMKSKAAEKKEAGDRELVHGEKMDFFKKQCGKISVIAEIKLASPSKGKFNLTHGVVELVKAYEEGGAECISVVTEEDFFNGSRKLFQQAKENSSLPLLRKDFLIDIYQLYESKVMGAKLVLLIAAVLEDKNKIEELIKVSEELDLIPLVEVHTGRDLEKALKAGAWIIGINNRDLKKFITTLERTRDLLPLIPQEKVVISESGIRGDSDMLELKKMAEDVRRVDGVLVGEAIVKSDFPAQKIRELKEAGF